jgi:hypothetical protein
MPTVLLPMQLTEGFMMEPGAARRGTARDDVVSFQRPKSRVGRDARLSSEAQCCERQRATSTRRKPVLSPRRISALVFHHPYCAYFGVGGTAE